MDAQSKKTALRMIPYGLYVLTSESASGRGARAAASTRSSSDEASGTSGVTPRSWELMPRVMGVLVARGNSTGDARRQGQAAAGRAGAV